MEMDDFMQIFFITARKKNVYFITLQFEELPIIILNSHHNTELFISNFAVETNEIFIAHMN